jgi:hypothetical protein
LSGNPGLQLRDGRRSDAAQMGRAADVTMNAFRDRLAEGRRAAEQQSEGQGGPDHLIRR